MIARLVRLNRRHISRGKERVNRIFRVAQNILRDTVAPILPKGQSMTIPTDSVPLLKRTQDLVKCAPRTISYAEMGRQIGVSGNWVGMFAKDLIPDPGVKKVQALHDFLANVGN